MHKFHRYFQLNDENGDNKIPPWGFHFFFSNARLNKRKKARLTVLFEQFWIDFFILYFSENRLLPNFFPRSSFQIFCRKKINFGYYCLFPIKEYYGEM